MGLMIAGTSGDDTATLALDLAALEFFFVLLNILPALLLLLLRLMSSEDDVPPRSVAISKDIMDMDMESCADSDREMDINNGSSIVGTNDLELLLLKDLEETLLPLDFFFNVLVPSFFLNSLLVLLNSGNRSNAPVDAPLSGSVRMNGEPTTGLAAAEAADGVDGRMLLSTRVAFDFLAALLVNDNALLLLARLR